MTQPPKRGKTAGYLRNYDLVSLRLLLSAIEEGNLAKVAERDDISLSAVSRRISDLEARIGVRLLHRHDRGVTPTDAASANLHRLRSLFDLIEQMSEDWSEISAGNKGVVRVRAHLTAIMGTLPHDIAAFMKLYPDIEIFVEEANSSDVIHALEIGGCDLGFVSGTVDTSSLDTHPWKVDELTVVLPADHRLAQASALKFSQILDFPFVGLQAGSSLQRLFRGQAATLGRSLNEVARVSTFEGVRDMVGAGLGLGILPAAMVSCGAPFPGIALARLDEPWAARHLVICTRDRTQMTSAARKFLGHLLQAS